jgi:alkanesulfonate monooxygenase SsuD/methylene tetrahydromethanopterin reductase-like flavin-dependent oxidoreductase (luciferase family)
MTNLYVLPFRNPYLVAKTLTTLDVMSAGRLIAGVGAGYLRSEFSALGVDFDQRAGLLDSGLDALVRIWTRPDRPVDGEGFAAIAPLWLSPPVQKPHPPIWIGGNSRAARRRGVQLGQGWMPVIAPPSMASSIRTAVIDSHAKFGQAVEELRAELSPQAVIRPRSTSRSTSHSSTSAPTTRWHAQSSISTSWPTSARRGRSCTSTRRR